MIRLPLRRRAVTALALAAFLFGSAGTALGAHRCPHHGAVGPYAPAAAAPAGHHGHHADPAAADHDAGAGGERSCTCLGTCHGAATVAAPAGGALAHHVPPPAVRSADAPEPAPARPQAPYLLPFANAPPRG